jgi:hypothetical protein
MYYKKIVSYIFTTSILSDLDAVSKQLKALVTKLGIHACIFEIEVEGVHCLIRDISLYMHMYTTRDPVWQSIVYVSTVSVRCRGLMMTPTGSKHVA